MIMGIKDKQAKIIRQRGIEDTAQIITHIKFTVPAKMLYNRFFIIVKNTPLPLEDSVL